MQEEELEEAAVNKREGRDNENLKGTYEVMMKRCRKTSAEDEDEQWIKVLRRNFSVMLGSVQVVPPVPPSRLVALGLEVVFQEARFVF